MSEYTQLGELDKLSDGKLSKLIERIKPHKRRSKEFAAHLNSHFYDLGHKADINELNLRKQIPKIEECGSYLLFRNYYLQKDTRLVSANFCKKHTLCGLCAIRRAAKAALNLDEKIRKILDENPSYKTYFVTITVRNEPDLNYAMRKLKGAWRKARDRRNNATRAKKTKNPENSKYASALDSAFADITGGVYSIETTWSDKHENWHPHMHALFTTESQLSQWRLREEWKEITPDNSYMIDVQEVDPLNDKRVALEIMKYAMKFSNLPFKQHVEAYLALLGRRLKGTIGDFRGVDLEPDPADDKLEGEPYIEIMLSYFNGDYQETGERRAGVEQAEKQPEWVRSDLLR